VNVNVRMKETQTLVDVVSDEGAKLGAVTVSIGRPLRSKATLMIAHGAGGTMATPSLVDLQARLVESGVTAARFNFLYAERGKRAPDRKPVLLATWRAAADWVRKKIRPKKFFLGGRSMGGRMASYLVADGYPCDGGVFLAYPLHPPGKPDRLRKDHLPEIAVPMLFVSGTRDAFARLDLLETAVSDCGATLHLIEGADHGFKVRKKNGRTANEVAEEVASAVGELILEA